MIENILDRLWYRFWERIFVSILLPSHSSSAIALVVYLEGRRIFWPPYRESQKFVPCSSAGAPFLARCILWERHRCVPLLTLYTQSKRLLDHPPLAPEEGPDHAFHCMRHLLAVPVVSEDKRKENSRLWVSFQPKEWQNSSLNFKHVLLLVPHQGATLHVLRRLRDGRS